MKMRSESMILHIPTVQLYRQDGTPQYTYNTRQYDYQIESEYTHSQYSILCCNDTFTSSHTITYHVKVNHPHLTMSSAR